jgi:uncharacterized protein
MDHTLLVVLLALLCLAGLALIALGLPGLWVMVVGVVGYAWLTGFHGIGLWTIVTVLALAAIGEAIELWLGFRLVRRYGGSKWAGWGALFGGLVGALVGAPIPVVGSVVEGLVGCFVGALLVEYLGSRSLEQAARAGWGALVGRVLASTAKIMVGIVITVIAMFGALR